MYYIFEDPNVKDVEPLRSNLILGLYHLADKNANILDSRYATDISDAKWEFLHHHKELRDEDILEEDPPGLTPFGDPVTNSTDE